jgi:hypothetical protein
MHMQILAAYPYQQLEVIKCRGYDTIRIVKNIAIYLLSLFVVYLTMLSVLHLI